MHLPRPIYDKIIAHARNGAPYEVCGLLRGREGVVTAWHPATNIAADPRQDYEIAPEDLLVALAWEEAGDELIAIYHSHPASPAYPSPSDAWNAYYPDTIYLICSLQEEAQPCLRGFILRQRLASFDLESIRQTFSFQETRPGFWSLHLPPQTPIPHCLQTVMPAPPAALYVLYRQRTASQVPELRLVSVEPVEINVGNLS
ncbi:MAG: M67 family metallopeptidase [Chloroflexi bacterium]|nr:M67 family metallopeptidase [Chloroflexota bacterium]